MRKFFWEIMDDYSPAAKVAGLILTALELIVTIACIIYAAILNVFPPLYFIIGIIILILMFEFVFFSQIRRGLHILGKIIAVLMIIVLSVASFYLMKTNKMLDTVTTTKTYDKVTVDLAVLATDQADKVIDTKDYVFGTYSAQGLEDERNKSAVAQIEEITGAEIKTKEYSSLAALAQALYNKEVGAILYNDSFTPTITESFSTFEDDTIIIQQFEYKQVTEEVSVVDSNVLTEPFIVYISGNDDWGDEVATIGRSDVNILVAVNPNTNTVLLLTTPRDYYVPFPDVTEGRRDKLTHAGNYGMNTQIATLENLYDITINYYVRVNFTSLVDIIYAIGGITLYNDVSFYSDSDYNYYYPEGEIYLNGDEAIWYCRERHNLDNGDYGRGYHQQLVIEAIINKMTSVQTLAMYTTLTDVISTAAITNMPKEKITDIVQNQLTNNPKWNIVKAQAEGCGMYQLCYSTGDQPLSVCMPYAQSIEYCKTMLNTLIDGGQVVDLQMGEDDDYSFVAEPEEVSDELYNKYYGDSGDEVTENTESYSEGDSGGGNTYEETSSQNQEETGESGTEPDTSPSETESSESEESGGDEESSSDDSGGENSDSDG